MLAYISDKSVNFASANGNSPVKAFEDTMLKKNKDNVNGNESENKIDHISGNFQ